MTKDIKDSVSQIRDECDNIEEFLEEGSEDDGDDGDDEDKQGKTRGDPVVELF